VLKLKEEPVAPRAREVGVEGDRIALDRRVSGMHVQEGEIPVPDGYQVCARPEIGLKVSDETVLAVDLELKRRTALGFPQDDPVAVVGVATWRRLRKRSGPELAETKRSAPRVSGWPAIEKSANAR
jgi:hypothetical protein